MPCGGGDDGDGDDALSRRMPGRRTPEPVARQQGFSSWEKFSTKIFAETIETRLRIKQGNGLCRNAVHGQEA
jgi:hypothetical protein